jgi:hypothetical protein
MDLGGFSGQGPDLGVKAFLDNMGFIPSTISLLTTCPDFIHEHDGRIDHTPLRFEYTSYGGWRKTRRWTRCEYKTVVAELRRHGINVLLSLMANAYHPTFEKMSDWAKQHPELFVVHDTGLHSFVPTGLFAGARFYHIAARFADGQPYHDFFAQQITRTVSDYGFDGFHAGDGFKSFVLGIMAANFSPDMLEQFAHFTGRKLPCYDANNLTESIPPVARWIWKNHRLQWIDFWRQRFSEAWHAVAASLKAADKSFCINSAYCTDPLESLARFGMDLGALEHAGTESVYFEPMDCCAYIDHAGPRSDQPDGYNLSAMEFYANALLAMLQRSVHTPRMKTIQMIHVHDQFERAEQVKSERSYVERAIIGYQQTYHIRRGKTRPATPCVWYEFTNDIAARDWSFLDQTDALARALRTTRPAGPIALWSPTTVENELPTAEKHWSVHRSLYELMTAGLRISSAANVDECAHFDHQPLLWANPNSFSTDEQNTIWQQGVARRNRIIVFDPRGQFQLPATINAFKLIDAHSGATLAITGNKTQLNQLNNDLAAEHDGRPDGSLTAASADPYTWTFTPARKTKPLEYRHDMAAHWMTRIPPTRLSPAYMACAAALARRIAYPLITDLRIALGPHAAQPLAPGQLVFYTHGRGNSLHLFVENLNRNPPAYLTITFAHAITSFQPLNSVLYHPAPRGREVDVVASVSGISVYKLTLENQR